MLVENRVFNSYSLIYHKILQKKPKLLIFYTNVPNEPQYYTKIGPNYKYVYMVVFSHNIQNYFQIGNRRRSWVIKMESGGKLFALSIFKKIKSISIVKKLFEDSVFDSEEEGFHRFR